MAAISDPIVRWDRRARGGAQEFVGAGIVGKRAGDVAGHRREEGTDFASAGMSCFVQFQISTKKPSSASRFTRSRKGSERNTISAQAASVNGRDGELESVLITAFL